MRALVLAIGLILGSSVSAENGVSYVDVSKPIREIEDVNREADAWAMCAASYDAASEFMATSDPAQAKLLSELANGAELAVIVSMVADNLSADLTPERFNALWTMSKLTGAEMPKTKMTLLRAQAEAHKDESSKFIDDLLATVQVCVKNLSGQQLYIDTWRELARSGLLQLPEE